MTLRIGIRRETKSDWERRAPLTPRHVKALVQDHGLSIAIEPSVKRAFDDEAYVRAGATLSERLDGCALVLGVKEIPPDAFRSDTTYAFFSHTIKGQPTSMPMLRALLDRGASLIDYERIVDAADRRLIGFSRFAGLAGTIDSLWALGRRLASEGTPNPFERIRQAHQYDDLADALHAIRDAGERIARDGLPPELCPLVIGIAGAGGVSGGAQEILNALGARTLTPAQLLAGPGSVPIDRRVYQVVFDGGDWLAPGDGGPFTWERYLADPAGHESTFERYLPWLTVLITALYWEPGCPRLMTRESAARLYSGDTPRLRVIGDVSLDIEGAIEFTVKATEPDAPVYVYDVDTEMIEEGIDGNGPVILAVDFLPAELPVDASRAFGDALAPFMPDLARALEDPAFAGPGGVSTLPPEIAGAMIVHRGELTEPYRHLEDALRERR